MTRLLFLISLLCLAACQTLPTSERLELIRAEKEGVLSEEMKLAGLSLGAPAFIRVFKEESILEAWVQDKNTKRFIPFKSYPICNYSGELGPKLKEGDKQAPEGFYTVGANQMNPWSRHLLSFNLGYPNEYDEVLGRTGNALMIHGGCTSIGCYAMTDPAIEEIYLLTEASIRGGHDVPVHIFPFRMHAQNMFEHRNSEWLPFWENIKQGYDAFEITRTPPKASGYAGVYEFEDLPPVQMAFF